MITDGSIRITMPTGGWVTLPVDDESMKGLVEELLPGVQTAPEDTKELTFRLTYRRDGELHEEPECLWR